MYLYFRIFNFKLFLIFLKGNIKATDYIQNNFQYTLKTDATKLVNKLFYLKKQNIAFELLQTCFVLLYIQLFKTFRAIIIKKKIIFHQYLTTIYKLIKIYTMQFYFQNFIQLQTITFAIKFDTFMQDLNRGATNTNTKLGASILINPLLRHNAQQHCK